MFTLRIKLLIPTLLTTLLFAAGIGYITVRQYDAFQKASTQRTETLRQGLFSRIDQLFDRNDDLTNLLHNNWQFVDNLILRDMEGLLDVITPYYEGLDFDLVAFYDPEAKLLVRADKPGFFGETDQLMNRVLSANDHMGVLDSLVLFENKMIALSLSRMDGMSGPIGVLAVGHQISQVWLDRFIAHNDHLMISLSLGETTLQNEHYDLKVLEAAHLKKTHMIYQIPGNRRDNLGITLWEDPSVIEARFQRDLTIITFPLIVLSFLVVVISHRVVQQTVQSLQEAREAAERAKQELEDRVEERTVELREVVGELQEEIAERKRVGIALRVQEENAKRANVFKSQFLANMSHEIRTPLNAIIGLTGLALQVELSAKVRDYLEKITRSSHSLLRLISDILDFSKIEAGKLELEHTDFLLRDLFDHLSNLFRTATWDKQVELVMGITTECRHQLRGDPLRLEQVLMNMISNALKFTESGEVVVWVRGMDETADGEVVLLFSIRDSGIGMTEAETEGLFEAFTQADNSTTRKFGGTGLGLAISKQLVQLMNGHVWVESEPGKGSTFFFTVTLPRGSEGEGSEMTPPEGLGGLKVLVVEDNAAARDFISELLGFFGFVTTAVASETEGLAAWKIGLTSDSPYELVMMDVASQVSGLAQQSQQFIHEISSSDQGSPPKIILMVGNGEVEDIHLGAGQANVGALLAKPLNCSSLFDTIMDLFGQEVEKVSRPSLHETDPDEVIAKVGGSRVLLVEDNAINRQVAGEVLEGVGLVVEMAVNGLEAVEMVSKSDYDVVLMDIQMPEMDGYAATARIREDSRFMNLPILAMTAHAMVGVREKCLAVGMDDHLTKPIDKKQLFAALIHHIEPKDRPLPVAVLKPPPLPEDETLSVPETLAGIDTKAALTRLNQNQGLFRSILKEFHHDFADSATMIRKALGGRRKGDMELAERLSHSVKGMAGNLSAEQLFRAARDLEEGIRKQHRETWPELLDRYEEALGVVITSIEQLQKREEESNTSEESVVAEVAGELDREAIALEMKNLFRCITEFDPESQESFDSLKGLLAGAPGEIAAELDLIEGHLDRFDFADAQLSLDKIGEMLGGSSVEEEGG
ncbi:MAG: response regulator [Magnetococcales bacterium]|nr:response regulator [Magnetococcales bacterium]